MKFVIDTVSRALEVPEAILEMVQAEDGAKEKWTVEIATLEDLLTLAYRTTHPLIIFPAGTTWDVFALPFIEIYDDYRE
jgi:hypothetical protein